MSKDECRVCGKPLGSDGVWSGLFWVYEEECPEGKEGETGYEPSEAVVDFFAHPSCMQDFVKRMCANLKIEPKPDGWPV
jgi:hypothetical protein